jgi:hypothetical protein
MAAAVTPESLMGPTFFLRFASVIPFLCTTSLLACSGSDCDIPCVANPPPSLLAPKSVSTAVSSTANCSVKVECDYFGNCKTLVVTLEDTGPCDIAITYVDGTSFAFASNISRDTGCCGGAYLDNTTVGG